MWVQFLDINVYSKQELELKFKPELKYILNSTKLLFYFEFQINSTAIGLTIGLTGLYFLFQFQWVMTLF